MHAWGCWLTPSKSPAVTLEFVPSAVDGAAQEKTPIIPALVNWQTKCVARAELNLTCDNKLPAFLVQAPPDDVSSVVIARCTVVALFSIFFTTAGGLLRQAASSQG